MLNSRFFVRATLLCLSGAGGVLMGGAPAWAQPDPQTQPMSDLPYREVSPAEAEKLVGGNVIALHLRDVTLAEALQSLQKQSGVTVDLPLVNETGELGKTLSIDLETRSFNQAFRALVEKAGVNAILFKYGNRENLSVVVNPNADMQDNAPQSGIGRFQVRVNGLSSALTKTVTPSANNTFTRDQTSNLSVGFDMALDPQMPDIELPILRLSRAEDEKGRSLLPPPRPMFPGFERRGYGAQFSFSDLRIPAEGAQKLAHLEGTAICAFPTGYEKWEVPDLVNAAGWNYNFQSNNQIYRFEVVKAKREGDKVDVKLEVSPPFDSQKIMKRMKLVDAQGHLFDNNGSSSDGSTIEAQFGLSDRQGADKTDKQPHPPSPLKLSFEVPTEWVQTAIPFSFENVPLPQLEK